MADPLLVMQRMNRMNRNRILRVYKRVGVKYDEKIAVVALDPLAGASYTKEVRDLFGEYAEVVGYSVRDGSAAGVLPRADLFAISTDAYGSAEEEARHVPMDSQIMSIEVTFYWETLKNCLRYHKERKCCL